MRIVDDGDDGNKRRINKTGYKRMNLAIKKWQRITYKDRAIYLMPQGPDWFVPNAIGDRLIQRLMGDEQMLQDTLQGNLGPKIKRFVSEISDILPESEYQGRIERLELAGLTECWFHITNQCNLSCSHCMFSCCPANGDSIGYDAFKHYFFQAFDLGSRTFFLTGGEPLIHPEFQRICKTILDRSAENQLVILTNGIRVEKMIPFFKTLDQDRIHFQISLDGDRDSHDRIRGKGSFEKTISGTRKLAMINKQVSFAMSVNIDNVGEMITMVNIAGQCGISNIHYLWPFMTGKAENAGMPVWEDLFIHLKKAYSQASALSITIDNIEMFDNQIFSSPGTKYDQGIAGWQSLAIDPNGWVYPTPALIGQEKANCGSADKGLVRVWQQSEVLEHIRALSVHTDPAFKDDPLRYLTGGSDMDHSFYHGKRFIGSDPYSGLANEIVKWRILSSTGANEISWPCVQLRMGDRHLSCDTGSTGVALTHSNCVLSLSALKTTVGQFYAGAAEETNEDIVNPVCYPQELIEHIPEPSRVRSYGCGSPVLDADVQKGEILLDLGSGAGTECFIAAQKTGPDGQVIGIDMTDTMIRLSKQSARVVGKNLGYENIVFKKADLEALPIENDSIDVIISNCVINLTADKQNTFMQIYRSLKPGGRMVISDIVTDQIPSAVIMNDDRLRGECIAGAMTQKRLIAVLEMTGFVDIKIKKRFLYRRVQDHPFYSLTYTAYKPDRFKQDLQTLYPGPFAAVITDAGHLYLRGEMVRVDSGQARILDDQLLVLDENGSAINTGLENSCACYLPPESWPEEPEKRSIPEKHMAGCMQCGSPLIYFKENKVMPCSQCGQAKPANAMCESGHFICDTCHSKDGGKIVTQICLETEETDMIRILNLIRQHPVIPLHGPEHHFAVPGAIVAAYRNSGGSISPGQIRSAIERGSGIPGGSCGFWGGCGAALGVGIGFGVILESSPIKADQRFIVQQVTGQIIEKLNRVKAARCCQRETWTALVEAARLSRKFLPVPLQVDADLACTQMAMNKECPGKACPYFKTSKSVLFQRI